MPSPSNCLPVYSPDHELLYHAPIGSVPRLLESGRVRPVGTKHRVRALIAVCGDATAWLRLSRPPTGRPESHNRETEDNPRGVWTFRKVSHCAA
jgi:hypothetical protein